MARRGDAVIALALFALAQTTDAEGERIAEEVVRYAMVNKWRAVDDQYTRLVEHHPTALTGEVHRLAAQAARTRGDLLLAAQRLQRVEPDDPAADAATRDLESIRSAAGLVMIAGRTLTPVTMPFVPELRAAVRHASDQVAATHRFVGLLPAGDYTVDGVTLTVVPGFHWQVLVADKTQAPRTAR